MKEVLAVLVVLATASAVQGYTGASISAYDIQAGDVPGPQPIRVFPVPAAANMAGAQLLYDNAARLGFSANYITMANANRVTFPLTAPGITINTLDYQYGVGRPIGVNNSLFYFTNTETTPADDRFPTHIPRPGRYANDDYSAVQFVLSQPAKQFGVFVAMNSHFAPGQPPYDDNNVLMYPSRKLWVAVLGESDTFATAQMQQISVANLYAPFIKVTYNGSSRIRSVCVVQDAAVEYNAPFGFFDPYSVVSDPPMVNAGPDQTITLPAAASLDGTVSDDGLPNPPAAVTTTWSMVSGPGTVAFANANAVDTTATFSAAGTYILQLLANDSALQSTDTVTVTVNSRPGDVDGDGHVDVVDLLWLVDAFGTYLGDAAFDARCDFNRDGAVDVVDLLDVVYNFGQ